MIMNVFFLWVLFFLLIFILFKLVGLDKNYVVCLFITLFIVIFIVNLKISIFYVLEGGRLWITSLVPTIFPFTVLCNLLIFYEGIELYSKFIGPIICKPLGLSKNCSFAIATSFLCGYPLGAMYSTNIYTAGYINRNEYIRLLNIATNCGPLFILGPIGTIMLGNVKYGYLLLIANYISIIVIGLITKTSSKQVSQIIEIPKKTPANFGECLKNSIENATKTTFVVGGFIIMFSVIIGIIKSSTQINYAFYLLESFFNLPKDSIYSIFLGCIEITNGCNLINVTPLSISMKLSIISFLCSFSGFSIIAQVSSFISLKRVSIIKYSLLKTLQGIISFLITLIISYLLIP